MLFYTQQHVNFLKNKEILYPDPAFEDGYLKQFYPFMKQAYHDKINQDFDVSSGLIWGWPTISEAFLYYEDMPKSDVIIEANIPDTQVLKSDFDAWHLVLNNYMPEVWPHMFSEEALHKDGFLENADTFTPQLVIDHLDRKNICNVFYR